MSNYNSFRRSNTESSEFIQLPVGSSIQIALTEPVYISDIMFFTDLGSTAYTESDLASIVIEISTDANFDFPILCTATDQPWYSRSCDLVCSYIRITHDLPDPPIETEVSIVTVILLGPEENSVIFDQPDLGSPHLENPLHSFTKDDLFSPEPSAPIEFELHVYEEYPQYGDPENIENYDISFMTLTQTNSNGIS